MAVNETNQTHIAFVYECLECWEQFTADRRPDRCPECDGPLRNTSFQPDI